MQRNKTDRQLKIDLRKKVSDPEEREREKREKSEEVMGFTQKERYGLGFGLPGETIHFSCFFNTSSCPSSFFTLVS